MGFQIAAIDRWGCLDSGRWDGGLDAEVCCRLFGTRQRRCLGVLGTLLDVPTVEDVIPSSCVPPASSLTSSMGEGEVSCG